MKRNRDKEEEERFINVKVVEYLEPLMSRELLCKYPDNSAFDFNYTQSSIWSPLIPRAYIPLDMDSITPIKLSNDFGFGVVDLGKKSIEKSVKKKQKTATFSAFGINLRSLFKKKEKEKENKIRASEFSPTPIKNSCLPLSSKTWGKVLKVKTKKKKKKKKDSGMRVKLTNCLIKRLSGTIED